MHDGVQYDPIQGGVMLKALESWKSGHFQKLSPPSITMGAGNWILVLTLVVT